MNTITSGLKKLFSPKIPDAASKGMRFGETAFTYSQITDIRDDKILLMGAYPHLEYIADWEEFRNAAMNGQYAQGQLSRGWDVVEHQRHRTFPINTTYQGQHIAKSEKDIQIARDALIAQTTPFI